MASGKFDKSSTPSLAALVVVVLLGVVLAGSFAPACASIVDFPDAPDLPEVPIPAPEAGATELRFDNKLNRDNDVNCTISKPLVGIEKSVFVEAQESQIITIQPAQPFTSRLLNVTVFGEREPLGGGKLYSTSGDFLQRIVSLTGYIIVILRGCVDQNSNTGLFMEGYTKPPAPANTLGVFINYTCAALQMNN